MRFQANAGQPAMQVESDAVALAHERQRMLALPQGHTAIIEVAPITNPLKLRRSPLDIIRFKQQVAVEIAANSGASI